MVKWIVLAALLFAQIGTAGGNVRSAKELADGCAVANAAMDGTADQKYGEDRFGERAITVGICYGYIEGFLQGYSAGRHPNPYTQFCIPEGVSTPQIARLLEDRMKKTPELEHIDRMPYLMGLLTATWPCE